MAKFDPELLNDESVTPPELVFRWRRFRFPSFKFFVVLIGSVVVHLTGFYLFDLAQGGETETIREDAHLLILRSEDPQSNRVLLAHFDALNAYQVALNPRKAIDTGVNLAPSFVDYSLQPLPMPKSETAPIDVPFPSYTKRSVIHLAPMAGWSATSGVETPSAVEWLAPQVVAVTDLEGGESFELPVSWDASFWSQNYGRSVIFDLGIDVRGVVRVALGERAAPEVLQAVRKELIGQRLPLSLEETAADAIVWKRYRVELW